MSSANVEAVRDMLDAWNRGDLDALLHKLHPESEWVSEIAQAIEGSETVYRGKEEMRPGARSSAWRGERRQPGPADRLCLRV